MSKDILISSRRVRRKRLILKAVFLLFGFLIFMAGIVALFYIPKFRINEISVQGIEALDVKQFKGEVANLLSGKLYRIIPYNNIFIIPAEKITTELLQKFPLLKTITVIRDFSQKLSIEIKERKPEAIWCHGGFSTDSNLETSTSTLATSALRSFSEGGCAFVDEEGFIFGPAPLFSGTIFLKFFDERGQSTSTGVILGEPAGIGKEMIPDAEFQKLRSFKDLLVKNDINVAKIILKDEGIYEVYSKEGWYILLNAKNEPNPSFNNLKLVLDTQIKEKRPKLEYIDFRFGKKVFFKFK